MKCMNYKEPLVSIVIPVKNGAKTFRRSLTSLVNQSFKNIEIIIVDNFSTDKTAEIVQEFRKKDHRVKFFRKGPERGAQMRRGISKARGKYIFITASDMVVDKELVEKAVDKCEDGGFDAVYGHIKSETKGYWSRVKALERRLYVNDALMEAAFFYRRKVFLGLGGYDRDLVGVEEEFQHRLDKRGFKTGKINVFETHIDEIDSLKEIVLKSFYYGQYDIPYFKKYPLLAFKKRFPIRAAFFRNFNLLIKDFDLFIGFIILKIFQYSFGLAGLLLGLAFTPHNAMLQKMIYEKKKK